MKNYNKRELAGIIAALEEIYDSESVVEQYPRVGDRGTPLSIERVVDDEENRTTVVVWGDGSSTKAVANPDDEYDFTIGLGLCIAKKFVKNLGTYAAALHKSARCVHVKKKAARSSHKE